MNTFRDCERGLISILGARCEVIYICQHEGTRATLAMAIKNINNDYLRSLDQLMEEFFGSTPQVKEKRPENVEDLYPEQCPLKEYEISFRDNHIVVSRWDVSNRRSENTKTEYGFVQLDPIIKSWQQPTRGKKHSLYVIRERIEPEQTELVLEQFCTKFIKGF